MSSLDLANDPDLVSVAQIIAQVRQRSTLVHCITAAVSMGIVADGLLAAGVRPVMTETLEEAPTVDTIADALLINLGTLSTDAMTGIPATVEVALHDRRPWVLDPTAIGIAPVRTPLARRLLDSRPAVVRGNASEIVALTGNEGGRGADASIATEALQVSEAAHRVATRTGGVVAVSGAVDLVTDGRGDRPVHRGDPLLSRVTGTGCLLGGLTAACVAVTGDHLQAALAATVWMNIAGEIAAARAPRPGTFRVALLDALDEVGEQAAALAAPIP